MSGIHRARASARALAPLLGAIACFVALAISAGPGTWRLDPTPTRIVVYAPFNAISDALAHGER